MKQINIIVAVDENGGFGKQGQIPWHFKKDFKHFKDTTKDSVCIMGRKTYEEILEKNKGRKKKIKDLLPGRMCYVLSRNTEFKPKGNCLRFTNLREAVDAAEKLDKQIFVLGGEKLFVEALAWARTIYMTIIEGIYNCDRFFPVKFLTKYYDIVDGQKETENDTELKFITYKRRGF